MIYSFFQRHKERISFGIKLLVVVLACWVIYREVFHKKEISDITLYLNEVIGSNQSRIWFLAALLLMPANWGLETLKWMFLMKKVEPLPFFSGIQAVFSGVTISVFTPNRIGEYGGRVLYLSPNKRIRGALATLLGSLAQFLTTIIFGGLALIFFFSRYVEGMNLPLLSTLIFLVLLSLGIALAFYFHARVVFGWLKGLRIPERFTKYLDVFEFYRNSELMQLLWYSMGRYLVFTLQYYFLLQAFQVNLSLTETAIVVPVTFLTMTAIPSIALAELGIREVVALQFIGLVSNNDVGILSASFALWFINLAIPAMVGGLTIFRVRLFQKEAGQ